VQAQSGAEKIMTSTDDSGHTVYVSDFASAPQSSNRAQRRSSVPAGQSLVFWSVTDHRWKPVPRANIRAARSAAAEVNRYLGADSGTPALKPERVGTFSQADIDAAIEKAAERHNVDANLVRAVIKVESNFNPNAVSRKGAMGLMQLMPQTARQLNVTNPFDPEQNVEAGVRHLKRLMESYGGDVRLTLAAYNAGPGAVARSAGIPHYAETRDYVRRITRLYNGGSVSGPGGSTSSLFRAPIHVERDERGVLYISNTD
jgi:soluble lytic murein transglycosylase-like protein